MMKRMIAVYDKVIGRVVIWAASLGALLLLIVTAITFYEVVMRYVFQAPTVWSLDISGVLLLWGVLLGGAYTLRQRGHIFVELLLTRLSLKTRRRFGIFSNLLVSVFILILIWRGAVNCMEAYTFKEVTLSYIRIPLYLPMLSIPVGGALLLLESINQLLTTFIQETE